MTHSKRLGRWAFVWWGRDWSGWAWGRWAWPYDGKDPHYAACTFDAFTLGPLEVRRWR